MDHSIYEKVDSVLLIISRWPLHILNTSMSSSIDSAVAYLRSDVMVAVESVGLNGSYETVSIIKGSSMLLGSIKDLDNVGIRFQGCEEVQTHLSEVIQECTIRYKEIQRLEKYYSDRSMDDTDGLYDETAHKDNGNTKEASDE